MCWALRWRLPPVQAVWEEQVQCADAGCTVLHWQCRCDKSFSCMRQDRADGLDLVQVVPQAAAAGVPDASSTLGLAAAGGRQKTARRPGLSCWAWGQCAVCCS